MFRPSKQFRFDQPIDPKGYETLSRFDEQCKSFLIVGGFTEPEMKQRTR